MRSINAVADFPGALSKLKCITCLGNSMGERHAHLIIEERGTTMAMRPATIFSPNHEVTL